MPNFMLEAIEALKFTHSFKYLLGTKICESHCSRCWDVVVNKPEEFPTCMKLMF